LIGCPLVGVGADGQQPVGPKLFVTKRFYIGLRTRSLT